MSAPPRPETLPPDELDLLLSRRVDGDLSPDEAADLDAFLAASPEGRARLEALSSVVAALRSAPVPAASFALSTRVFSRVLEGSGAISGLFHRFGVTPKVAYVFVLMGGICIVAVGLLSKTPPAATVAGLRESAPSRDVVSVFIPASPASKESKKGGAPAAPAAIVADGTVGTVGTVGAGGTVGSGAREGEAKASRRAEPSSFSPEQTAARRADAPPADSFAAAPSREPPAALLAEAAPAESSASAASGSAAPSAPAGAFAAGSQAPAPPAASAGAVGGAKAKASDRDHEKDKEMEKKEVTAPLVPSISLVAAGGGPSPWKLAAIPALASLHGPLSARYRLSVSADGRVSSLKKISASPDPLPAAAETLLRDLRLERVPGVADLPEIEVRLTVP